MTEETKAPAPASERPSRPFGERSGGGDRPRFGGGGGGGRSGPGGPPREGGRKFFRRKKVCKFCTEKIADINYKDYRLLGPVRGRERQDRAPAFDRRVLAASAPAGRGHQAGAQYCLAAVCRAGIVAL